MLFGEPLVLLRLATKPLGFLAVLVELLAMLLGVLLGLASLHRVGLELLPVAFGLHAQSAAKFLALGLAALHRAKREHRNNSHDDDRDDDDQCGLHAAVVPAGCPRDAGLSSRLS